LYSFVVVLFLRQPSLFPLHPLQLVRVELALQIIIQFHQGITFFFKMIKLSKFTLKFFYFCTALLIFQSKTFDTLFHLFIDFLIHLALFGKHVKFQSQLLHFSHLFLNCTAKVIICWKRHWIFICTANTLAQILPETQQLLFELRVLFA